MAGYYDRQGDAVNDFDEYDPHPYSGGCDLVIAYGKPIPPSEDTCYPPSTPGRDESFDYGSESSPYGESHIDQDRPTYGSGSVPSYERPRPKPKPAHDFEPNAYGGEEYGERPKPTSSWNRPTPPAQEYHQPGYGEERKKPSYGYGEEEPQPPKFGSTGYAAEEDYGERPKPSWNRPTPPPQEYHQPGYGEEWKKPTYGYGEEEPQHPEFGSTGYSAEEEYVERPKPSSSWNRPTPPPQEYHQPGYGEEWKKPSYGYGEEEPQPPKFGSSGYAAEEEYGRPQKPSYYQQQEEETPKFERPTHYQPDQDGGYERPRYGGDYEKQKHGRDHRHHHHSYDDE